MVLRAAAHILMSRKSMKQDMLKYIMNNINTFGKDMGIRNSGGKKKSGKKNKALHIYSTISCFQLTFFKCYYLPLVSEHSKNIQK